MVTVATEMLLSEVRLLCTWEREASEVSHVRLCVWAVHTVMGIINWYVTFRAVSFN